MSIIFSRGCEYALRALVEMARHPGQTSWTVQELADRTRTPAPFLAKTFQALTRGKLLKSTRGRGGGFMFARPVSEIRLIDVVQLIDGPSLLTDCALGLPACGDENPCPFHFHWAGIRAAIIQALTEETLQHLARQTSKGPAGARHDQTGPELSITKPSGTH